MQPYFFPYLGYFQMINAVDEFVLYDDVNYIKRGWVHRNQILVNGEPKYISCSIDKPSQNKKINETYLCKDDKWKKSILKTIEYNYKKAPYFLGGFQFVCECLESEYENIAELNEITIRSSCEYLNIPTKITRSSDLEASELHGSNRIIDICKKKSAKCYINAPGGKHLYNQNDFGDIDLKFIHMNEIPSDFPYLSIIHQIMHYDNQTLSTWLKYFYLE